MRKTNQIAIHLAVAAALFGASTISFADAALEEVIVVATPIKDSQEAALNIKRFSDNVVDVISADTVGRFPDQNMADSLGRVPGMAIERDQGQTRSNSLLTPEGRPFLDFTLEWIDAEYGSVEAYFERQLGFSAADIEKLRAMYRD